MIQSLAEVCGGLQYRVVVDLGAIMEAEIGWLNECI